MKSSFLRALIYADIFDFPLTQSELAQWQIYTSPATRYQLKPLNFRGFYFLPNRRSLVSLRLKRLKYSRAKLSLARQIGEWLKKIPTIKLVGLTGTLAMNNAGQHDDIDLIIITAPHTLWLTRFFLVPLFKLFNLYRGTNIANRFCLNLWLDTNALALPRSARNLYTAHELAQIKPLVNKDYTHQRLLASNHWLTRFLPNIKIPKIHKSLFINHNSNIFNWFAFKIQYLYMRRKLTREKVTLHSAFFHPRNLSKIVLKKYYARLSHWSVRHSPSRTP